MECLEFQRCEFLRAGLILANADAVRCDDQISRIWLGGGSVDSENPRKISSP